ncbi:FAD-dependent monooxygenase [Aestuariivirga sp. YIM B02566]|uniref:FAD-dependent monooxygenase n=1 Tax=Taklimakanibacter albus TaxID=2800327 RepID=A0ACC5R409_9HYPH|nr:FAD-dependent monooxygenase [Aestuariivirga sp. YIM B02566]MBK1867394.1 FAD-dependent monooxygenase [Aestuariivirga sp. YIM B02566]
MPLLPVLIAGGGIAGLAGALGLARIGREARVLEQARAFETVGAGLQIGPNAVRALDYLGAWERVAPASFAPPGITIRDGHSGRILQHVPLGASFERRFGAPYRVIHRADLLAGLVDAAQAQPGITLMTAAPVKGFADRGEHVEVETDGTALTGEALLGADGIRSAIRAALLADGPPVRHAETLFRALAPIDVTLADPLANVTLWLCRGGHVVHYPVQGGKALNVVAATLGGDWPGDGWSAPAAADELPALFPDAHPELHRVLALPAAWQKWAAASRTTARTWTKGRIALIGDAAHASLPYLAQGAAMALEDAVVLARNIQTSDTIAGALRAYQALRLPRTQRIVAESRRLSSIYHARGPMRLARNVVLRSTKPEVFLSRLSWIYDFDPSAI